MWNDGHSKNQTLQLAVKKVVQDEEEEMIKKQQTNNVVTSMFLIWNIAIDIMSTALALNKAINIV